MEQETKTFEAHFTIVSILGSPDDLRCLIKDGELIEARACNNLKWFDDSANELVADAGLEDQFVEDNRRGDGAATVHMTIRYPLAMLNEIEARVEDLEIDDHEFDVPGQAA